jgi:hypothetical protein
MPDFEPTRTPEEVTEFLRRERLLGKSIGIYRFGAPDNDIPAEAWRGELPAPTAAASRQLADGTTVEACELNLDWSDLIARLTFGLFGPVLDLRLNPPTSPYWKPIIVTTWASFRPTEAHVGSFAISSLRRIGQPLRGTNNRSGPASMRTFDGISRRPPPKTGAASVGLAIRRPARLLPRRASRLDCRCCKRRSRSFARRSPSILHRRRSPCNGCSRSIRSCSTFTAASSQSLGSSIRRTAVQQARPLSNLTFS